MAQTEKSVLQQIRIIFMALLAGPVLFLVVTLVTERELSPQPELEMAGMAIAIAMIALSWFLPGQLARQNRNKYPAAYTQVKIIQLAMLEGAALFNLVIFFISGNTQSMLTGLIIVAVLAGRFPTMNDMKKFFPQGGSSPGY